MYILRIQCVWVFISVGLVTYLELSQSLFVPINRVGLRYRGAWGIGNFIFWIHFVIIYKQIHLKLLYAFKFFTSFKLCCFLQCRHVAYTNSA